MSQIKNRVAAANDECKSVRVHVCVMCMYLCLCCVGMCVCVMCVWMAGSSAPVMYWAVRNTLCSSLRSRAVHLPHQAVIQPVKMPLDGAAVGPMPNHFSLLSVTNTTEGGSPSCSGGARRSSLPVY